MSQNFARSLSRSMCMWGGSLTIVRVEEHPIRASPENRRHSLEVYTTSFSLTTSAYSCWLTRTLSGRSASKASIRSALAA